MLHIYAPIQSPILSELLDELDRLWTKIRRNSVIGGLSPTVGPTSRWKEKLLTMARMKNFQLALKVFFASSVLASSELYRFIQFSVKIDHGCLWGSAGGGTLKTR